LIGDLENLDDALWMRPSLCDGWTVHDVVAHLVDVALTTRLGLVVDIVRARFDFDRQNANGHARARGATPRQTLERLRQVASRTSGPPAPLDTRIVEEVVHGEDTFVGRSASPAPIRSRQSCDHCAGAAAGHRRTSDGTERSGRTRRRRLCEN
jgi:uncharacterized protein (TIGR03083 family)